MAGRNDGNSGSPETRRVKELEDERNTTDADGKNASQADGKADGNQLQAEPEEDIEVDRQASGE